MLIKVQKGHCVQVRHGISVKNKPFICDIAVYGEDTALYSRCDWVSYLWQQLQLISELECGLQSFVELSRKWLIDFNTGKTQLVLLDCLNNCASDVKMGGSVFDEK